MKLWQIEAMAKRKAHANSHPNPLGFDLVRGWKKLLSKFEGFRACASLRDTLRNLLIWISSVSSSVLPGKVVLFGRQSCDLQLVPGRGRGVL